MDFIYIERGMQPIPFAALLHPLGILPSMIGSDPGETGGAGAQFECVRVGIGFNHQSPGAVIYFEFV